jgi:hypothetical protein
MRAHGHESNTGRGARQRTYAAGFDAHLPVDADELIAVLSDLPRASRQR